MSFTLLPREKLDRWRGEEDLNRQRENKELWVAKMAT